MPTTIMACPSPTLQTPAAAPARSGHASIALARWKPLLVIGVVSACAWLPTVHQRAHYSDDYPNRFAIEKHGYWGAFAHYQQTAGWIRPAGYVSMLTLQTFLWDVPAAQQVILGLLHIALCIAAFDFVRRLCACERSAVFSAALLALWPSCTGNYVWVAGAAQLLPAYTLLLISLGCYIRHVDGDVRRRWWQWSFATFAASVLFHDQHLVVAVVFSLIACARSPKDRRVGRVIWTLPFWLASAVVGMVAVVTAATSDRVLSPSLTGALGMLPAVVWRFCALSVGEPVQQALHRAGPAESISRMLTGDTTLLVLSLTGLAIGVAVLAFGRPTLRQSAQTRFRERVTADQTISVCLVGIAIMLAGLALIAARPGGGMSPRHTMLPAIGACIVLGVGMARLQAWSGGSGRRMRQAAVRATICATLLGLGGLRLGAMYEWTTRTRVTDAVLDRLTAVQANSTNDPTSGPIVPGDLIVVDGVRRFGRGFADSWGLTGAATLRLGVPVRVATFVRRDGDGLTANAAWDEPWPIDDTTRYFRWDDANILLHEISLEQFIAKHRELEHNHG